MASARIEGQEDHQRSEIGGVQKEIPEEDTIPPHNLRKLQTERGCYGDRQEKEEAYAGPDWIQIRRRP